MNTDSNCILYETHIMRKRVPYGKAGHLRKIGPIWENVSLIGKEVPCGKTGPKWEMGLFKKRIPYGKTDFTWENAILGCWQGMDGAE